MSNFARVSAGDPLLGRWICRVILYLNWGTQLAAAAAASASDVDRPPPLVIAAVDFDCCRKKCQRNLRCTISVGAAAAVSIEFTASWIRSRSKDIREIRVLGRVIYIGNHLNHIGPPCKVKDSPCLLRTPTDAERAFSATDLERPLRSRLESRSSWANNGSKCD